VDISLVLPKLGGKFFYPVINPLHCQQQPLLDFLEIFPLFLFCSVDHRRAYRTKVERKPFPGRPLW
jgi:hypothetical protein